MFLNVDSFKKQKIIFNPGEDFFIIAGVHKSFSDISAFYYTSTEHFTNKFYEGSSLRVVLKFNQGQQSEVYEVDSNHQDHFHLLHHLVNAITVFRQEKLKADYQNSEEIFFAVRVENKSFRLHKGELYFGDDQVQSQVVDNNASQTQLEFVFASRKIVVESYSNDLYVELNGEQPAKEIMLPAHRQIMALTNISDPELFLELTLKSLPTTYKAVGKMSKKMELIFIYTVVVFGLNGWVAAYSDYGLLMNNVLVELVSIVARLILAAWVVLRPFFWFVQRINSRRIAKVKRSLVEAGIL